MWTKTNYALWQQHVISRRALKEAWRTAKCGKPHVKSHNVERPTKKAAIFVKLQTQSSDFALATMLEEENAFMQAFGTTLRVSG